MGWLDAFRRREPVIGDQTALAVFIDENAAFLVQKGIYEYARARAGHYAKVLFAEAPFLSAIEKARWQAYPLGLGMVGEMIEGVLRPHAGDARLTVAEGLTNVVMEVFDRYPVPLALGEEQWRAARRELARELAGVTLHPPKLVKDIPERYARAYFDLMPIHERLRALDFPSLRNYLKITLCNIHDRLLRRIDAPSLVGALKARSASDRQSIPV
jgi:hypothetical protein